MVIGSKVSLYDTVGNFEANGVILSIGANFAIVEYVSEDTTWRGAWSIENIKLRA